MVSRIVVALLFIGINALIFYAAGEAEAVPERRGFDAFPLEIGDWRCPQRHPMDPDVERVLGVTDYHLCTYQHQSSGQIFSLYVGYHERQVREGGSSTQETAIHPPKHCLPGSGWDIAGTGILSLDVDGVSGTPSINRFLIARGSDRQMVYYWYHSRGRVIHRDWAKVALMAWDRATRGRTDGSLVRFTIPLAENQSEADADAIFRRAAGVIVPRLTSFVPN